MRSARLILPAVLLTACSATAPAAPVAGDAPGPSASTPAAPSPSPSPAVTAAPVLAQEGATQAVDGAAAGELSVAASRALFTSAPVVVLVGEADPGESARAAELAVSRGVPLLVVPPPGAPAGGIDAEIARLQPQAVLAVGPSAAGWAARLDGVDVVPVDEQANLPETTTAPPGDTVVLVLPGEPSAAAAATARAAGAEVVEVPGGDPRGSADVVTRLAALAPGRVLGIGTAFGSGDHFAERVAVARTGVQLPGGGQLVLAGKRYIALYGHPGSTRLGALGEQGPQASVDRAVGLASEYAQLDPAAVTVPTFEIITTVADSAAGADGDYSSESTIEHLRPYVDAAARVGLYVVLDLQPGLADFLSQAKLYEELLLLPHVGLALDPEWRLKPGERHLKQIGRVGADEVNAVGDWLATLVRDNDLPQKMLLLHQFRTFMLEDRERIVSDRDELAVITQMDGHGPPSTKLDTWNVLRPNAPAGMTFGWKNFYDEDAPMLTPAGTLAVAPTPVFISYQ